MNFSQSFLNRSAIIVTPLPVSRKNIIILPSSVAPDTAASKMENIVEKSVTARYFFQCAIRCFFSFRIFKCCQKNWESD